MANKKSNSNTLFGKSNPNRRRHVTIAVATFFVVVIAATLVVVFASPGSFTLNRHTYSLDSFRAKGNARTSIASLASAASISTDTGKDCRDAWGSQPKIDTSFTYFCWRASDMAEGWIPQGITGSASAQTSYDGGNKDILVASWYTTGKPSLVAPTQTSSEADSASRMSVVNMRTHKYSHVELAKPCTQSAKRICKLNSHAGGIAWAGQYLYLASTTSIYVFDLNDIYIVEGKPVAVASERYTIKEKKGQAEPRLSTISFDSGANQLVTAEYHLASTKAPSRIARWNLDADHRLSAAGSMDSSTLLSINAYSVQGVASHQGAYIAQSSSETAPGRSSKGGTLLKWRKPSSLTRLRMPYHLESAYVDTVNKRVWAVTEGGSHSVKTFVFSYPSSVAF